MCDWTNTDIKVIIKVCILSNGVITVILPTLNGLVCVFLLDHYKFGLFAYHDSVNERRNVWFFLK